MSLTCTVVIFLLYFLTATEGHGVNTLVIPRSLGRKEIEGCSGASSNGLFHNDATQNIVSSILAGAFSCSTTHSLMVPIDLIKTKIQTNTQHTHAFKGNSRLKTAFQHVQNRYLFPIQAKCISNIHQCIFLIP